MDVLVCHLSLFSAFESLLVWSFQSMLLIHVEVYLSFPLVIWIDYTLRLRQPLFRTKLFHKTFYDCLREYEIGLYLWSYLQSLNWKSTRQWIWVCGRYYVDTKSMFHLHYLKRLRACCFVRLPTISPLLATINLFSVYPRLICWV